MKAHHMLVKQIKQVIQLCSSLSKNEHDQYAKCVEELMKAESCLGYDQSSECKCECHNPSFKGFMHCFSPCGCHDGNPIV